MALQNQYEDQLENIENYIDKFARIDLSELNSFEKEVIDLVTKGEIDKAIAKYEDENLLSKYMTQIQEFKKLDDAQHLVSDALDRSLERRDSIHRTIKHQVDLLRMAGGKSNFDKAMNLMRDVAMSDTTNFVAVFEYATYCRKVDRLSEALYFYNIGLRNAVPNSHEAVQARLGATNVLLRQREYYQVASSVYPILDIINELSKQSGNPNLYIAERIDAKKLLARACTQLKDSINAKKYYTEAVNDCEVLVNMDSSQLILLAETECMASQMYIRAVSNPDEAIAIGKKALEHMLEAYNSNPELYKAKYAFAQNTLASAYRHKRDFQLAEQHFLEADRLYTEAYKKNPEAYKSYLATNKQNMADLYLYKDDEGNYPLIKKALRYIQDSESLFKDLLKNGVESAELSLLYLDINYVKYYFNTGQYDRALKYSNIAIEGIKPYYSKFPTTYKSLYIITLSNHLDILDKLGKHKDAFEVFDRLIEVKPDEKIKEQRDEYKAKYGDLTK